MVGARDVVFVSLCQRLRLCRPRLARRQMLARGRRPITKTSDDWKEAKAGGRLERVFAPALEASKI